MARLTTLARCFWYLLLLTAAGSLSSISAASAAPGETNNQTDPTTISRQLNELESHLEDNTLNVADLDGQLSPLARYRNWAQKCIDTQEALLTKTSKGLTTLGEASGGEAAAVSTERGNLLREKAAAEQTLATCRVILLRSNELSKKVSDRKNALLAERLFARGPNIATLILDNWKNPAIWLQASKNFITENSGLDEFNISSRLLFIIMVALAFGGGLMLRKQLGHLRDRLPPPDSDSDRFIRSLTNTAHRYTAILLAALIAAGFIYVGTRDMQPLPFISIVAYGIPLVLLLSALIDLFLKTDPDSRFLGLIDEQAIRSLDRRLKILVVLIFIGYLLFATILAQSLPEPAMLLARAVFGAVLLINLAWVVWLVGQVRTAGKLPLFRIMVAILFIAVLAAEWLGYRNLSVHVFRILLGTWLVVGLYSLVHSLLLEQLDRLDTDRGHWQQRLRHLLGIAPGKHLPGLLWIRLLLTIVLWSVLFILLTRVWRVPELVIDETINTISNGFTIGSFEIVPLSLLMGVAVLVLLLAFNSWFRKWLEQEWLARSQMERGARESIAAISSYGGVGIAIIIALGIAGMDFSKLAIIAGALSVGIGFGLQNIVNNFISGLILLFERPVKTGDWVVIGDVEGYVKRISIRTTQIQTFDRADVIVPNSELISNSMTNWMLRDLTGRVCVPVGVAYGSDTAKAKEILLEIANSNENVIKDGFTAPQPNVLFREFGDSALNLELRCFIRNVDMRLRIVSEINFAIDAAFRENGIVVPFPQRELHIMDWPSEPGTGKT